MAHKLRIWRLPGPRKLLGLLLLLMLLVLLKAALSSPAQTALAPALLGRSIVLDAGHGGWDPGMMGEQASVEQQINLNVALKLAEYLRQAGAVVTLTRIDGEALAATKAADMAARVQVAEEAQAQLFISLHCNSYVSSREQHGAQVFYQKGSAEGQRLAETLQAALIAELGNNDRVALSHPDSYLLKNIDCPAVIAELGFLSNADEAAQLQDPTYQWQLAWAMFVGLEEFYSEE